MSQTTSTPWIRDIQDELVEARVVALKTESEFQKWLFGEKIMERWERWSYIYFEMKSDITKLLRPTTASQRPLEEYDDEALTKIVKDFWRKARYDTKVWYLYAWIQEKPVSSSSMRAVSSIVWVLNQVYWTSACKTETEMLLRTEKGENVETSQVWSHPPEECSKCDINELNSPMLSVDDDNDIFFEYAKSKAPGCLNRTQ